MGGARGGVQRQSSPPERGRHERAGERVTVLLRPSHDSELRFLCLQLLLDCSELESRLTETLGLVNADDCGRSQLATQSLITKHQVREKPPQSFTPCLNVTQSY